MIIVQWPWMDNLLAWAMMMMSVVVNGDGDNGDDQEPNDHQWAKKQPMGNSPARLMTLNRFDRLHIHILRHMNMQWWAINSAHWIYDMTIDYIIAQEQGQSDSRNDQALLLSIKQCPPLLSLKTMAIGHADIINNACHPLSEMTDKKTGKRFESIQKDMMICQT